MKSKIILVLVVIFCPSLTWSQKVVLQSPNQKIEASLYAMDANNKGEWYLKVSYSANKNTSEVLPKVSLGLSRSDQDFSKELIFLKASKPRIVKEHYALPFGKKSVRENAANEVTI